MPQEASETQIISLRLSRLGQLFNSLDPSPFHLKDLDADAEEYIEGSAREMPAEGPIKIAIHMPPEEAALVDAGQVQTAIQHYFEYREEIASRELRIFLRFGRRSLAVGLAALFLSVGARELLLEFAPGAVGKIFAEGLLIGGWVAMWQPVQAFIYDWRPLRARTNVLRRLSQASVELKPEPALAR